MQGGPARILQVLALTAVVTAAPAANRALPFPGPFTEKHQSVISKAGLFDWLFSGGQPPPEQQAEPKGRGGTDEDVGRSTRGRRGGGYAGSYRTVCVRLCDGFYFPISFATTRGGIHDDAAACERQCPSGSKLFFFRGSDQTVDDMVALDGKPYTSLAMAFRFRETYIANCTCRGNPWDPEALARHAGYARSAPSSVATSAAKPSKDIQFRHRGQRTYGYRPRQDAE